MTCVTFDALFDGLMAEIVLSSQLFTQPYQQKVNQRIAFLVGNSQKMSVLANGTKQFVRESV